MTGIPVIKQNLEYVKVEGLETVLDRLRSQGYNKVAKAVELECNKHPLGDCNGNKTS